MLQFSFQPNMRGCFSVLYFANARELTSSDTKEDDWTNLLKKFQTERNSKQNLHPMIYRNSNSWKKQISVFQEEINKIFF